MPRAKPFQCRRCGTLYTGGRCPKCYPAQKRRVTRGRKSGGGAGRRTATSVLGRWSPVNVDYLEEAAATAAKATRGGDPENAESASRSGVSPSPWGEGTSGTVEGAET